jgi:arylsulfatase A-like enzyme
MQVRLLRAALGAWQSQRAALSGRFPGMPDTGSGPPARPTNAIVVLLDSLNRHMMGAYGGREFATPNLDAFAARAVRFEKHCAGSLPCMPARHDILCGAMDFLWRPWGSIELWERPITAYLREQGVVTKLVTDHPHLFETGGENYNTGDGALGVLAKCGRRRGCRAL